MAYKAPKNEGVGVGVQRVVTGPKSIWIPTETGGRRLAEIGETITVSQHTANTFKDRLKDVAVAKAEAVVAKAEAVAAGVDEGGDSNESE